ncbi:hypothetical protein E2C01_065020 [Portunus trituberculatus]|uniref:Uncharacterized protein n=1 Tax=Portunus trituberculatus TaxID=210409 RepID=A0A5B7HKR8_PORTR|nr:hypothetical protein [Portunus trituberculatus]
MPLAGVTYLVVLKSVMSDGAVQARSYSAQSYFSSTMLKKVRHDDYVILPHIVQLTHNTQAHNDIVQYEVLFCLVFYSGQTCTVTFYTLTPACRHCLPVCLPLNGFILIEKQQERRMEVRPRDTCGSLVHWNGEQKVTVSKLLHENVSHSYLMFKDEGDDTRLSYPGILEKIRDGRNDTCLMVNSCNRRHSLKYNTDDDNED